MYEPIGHEATVHRTAGAVRVDAFGVARVGPVTVAASVSWVGRIVGHVNNPSGPVKYPLLAASDVYPQDGASL